MEDKLELDPRILVKNLEITKLKAQVDKLISDNVSLRDEIEELENLYNNAIKKLNHNNIKWDETDYGQK
tara:strand:+ start:323 stop:529 length:207 start_codon:yes stop_codon:yes gene_type:complete